MPPAPDVFAEKEVLRARQRQRLAQLGPEERRARSVKLLARLVALPAWQAARRVLIFAPLPNEPDLDLLWTNGGLAGKECAYPRVDGMQMHLLRVGALADLQPARWGLREPPMNAQALPLASFDLVLVPGLAFDADGVRLGRGGGFYDRLLAGKIAETFALGVAFASQITAGLPLAPHDVRMDGVLSDESDLRL